MKRQVESGDITNILMEWENDDGVPYFKNRKEAEAMIPIVLWQTMDGINILAGREGRYGATGEE